MAYINIMISNDATIRISNNQLEIIGKDKIIKEPVEDINSILIESLKSNISTYTISFLAENNVLIYICNKKHLPCAYVLPFYNQYNQLRIYELQKNLSLPLKKQLWASVVEHKIHNQNKCLELCGRNADLLPLIKKIKSGDNSNMEAVAASKYFTSLFNQSFTRDAENNINAALNYGYAIIRGVVARSIVSHGLVPFLGLKHHNIFNNYNLADDLIEVFRPYVDYFVFQYQDLKFDINYKKSLYNLINCNCDIAEGKYTLAYAIELYVQSYIKSLEEKDNKLKFPSLNKIEYHRYE